MLKSKLAQVRVFSVQHNGKKAAEGDKCANDEQQSDNDVLLTSKNSACTSSMGETKQVQIHACIMYRELVKTG